jgi:tetratricopeptide (TPR) repeat protein
MIRLALLVSLSAAVVAPSVARADAKVDIPARARELAERGRVHHEAGDYAAAIAAFTEAYALAPSPALLFNLAQSYRMGGHCDDAATMYKRFLASDPPAEARTLAEQHLISVEQCAEAQRPVLAPPALIVPMRTVIEPSPAEHRATMERDGGIGFGIGGGALLIGALVFELKAHDASSQVSDAYLHGGAGATVSAIDARGHHDAAVADVLGITGVAAVGAGVALYWMGTRESRARHVAVVPRGHGAEVRAEWRF